jgi:hypothetical protein
VTAIGRSRLSTMAALTVAVAALLLVARFAAQRLIAPHHSAELPALRPAALFAPSLAPPAPAALLLAPVPAQMLRALAPAPPVPAEAPPPRAVVHPARPAPDSLPPAPPLEHIEEDLWQP